MEWLYNAKLMFKGYVQAAWSLFIDRPMSVGMDLLNGDWVLWGPHSSFTKLLYTIKFWCTNVSVRYFIKRGIIQVQSFIIKCLSFHRVSFAQRYRLCIEKLCTWIILSLFLTKRYVQIWIGMKRNNYAPVCCCWSIQLHSYHYFLPK